MLLMSSAMVLYGAACVHVEASRAWKSGMRDACVELPKSALLFRFLVQIRLTPKY